MPLTDLTWNQKNLDYEIETLWMQMRIVGSITCLEIKRTSITRLKLAVTDAELEKINSAWNQKNLDYEIETSYKPIYRHQHEWLEIKRTSITRLKHYISWQGSRAYNLTWNQKNLDYEIETCKNPPTGVSLIPILKSKEPRLRDWNETSRRFESLTRRRLKSKEPRLRDWNNCTQHQSLQGYLAWNQKNLDYEIETEFVRQFFKQGFHLEIKRTSITRLKLFGLEKEVT